MSLRVLVTGAHSAIGQAFMKRVAGEIYTESVSLRGEGWKQADLSRYDCILHCAGIAHVRYSDAMQAEYMAVNRDLTLDIARRARDAGVKQFVFLSSMLVFGPAARAGETRMITAETAPAPENAYGLSKLEAENGLRALETPDFTVTIVRPPMVYGGGTKGNFSTLMKYAGKLPVFPRMGGRRSMIYMENLTEFLRLVINDRASGIFHPADREAAATPQIIRAIRAAQGGKTLLLAVFDPFIRLIGNTGAARRIFGGIEYSPELTGYTAEYRRHTLQSALKEML